MAINLKSFNIPSIEQQFKEDNRGGLGAFGEGILHAYPQALERLKGALDKGEISVSKYLEIGRTIASRADEVYSGLARSGSSQANAANAANPFPGLQKYGFKIDAGKPQGDAKRFNVDLGQSYERKLREELLPGNLSSEEREELLSTIPEDIGFDTERFAIEREGVRQKMQGKKTLEEQKGIQKTRLDELASLLGKQEEQSFNTNIPEIAGTAQAQGFLETSGFGNALARERSRLAQNTQNVLGLQSLADRDFEVSRVGEIAKGLNDYQTSGLQRYFGTEDRDHSEALARELARLSQPQQPKMSAWDKAAMIGQAAGPIIGAVGAGMRKGA